MRSVLTRLALLAGGVLAGLLVLASLEVVLRVLGVGVPRPDLFASLDAPAPLFERATGADGIAILRTAAARKLPHAETFLATKPPGGFRAFVVGGSSAAGVPYPSSYAFSAWLDRALEAALPDTPIEVVNAAVPGYASRRVLGVVREIAAYQPDLLIVYAGHNEFAERRYYAHLLDMDPRLFRLRALLARTHLYGLVASLTSGPPHRIHFDDLDNAREMFAVASERQAGEAYPSARELQYGELHYRTNLEEMARTMQAVGAKVALVTLGQNFADWAPGASSHRLDLDPQARQRWDAAEAEGARSRARGDCRAALAAWKQALAIDDRYAQLHFDVAGCERALGDVAAARVEYRLASDLDRVPHGAPTRFNAILADVAREQGLLLVHGLAALEAASPDGLVGQNLFVDFVHPNLRANQILARTIADALRDAGIPRPAAAWRPIPDPPSVETLVAADPTIPVQEHVVHAASCLLARRYGCARREAEAALRLDPGHAWAKTLLASADAAAARAAATGGGPS